MKKLLIGLFIFIASVQLSAAQTTATPATAPTKAEQEILELSKAKWLWMADKKTDTLDNLFAGKAVFVHMGGT